MKTNLHHIIAIAVCGLVAACDKAPEGGNTTTNQAQPAAAKAEAPDPNIPEKKVEMTGNDQIKFDVTSIEAQPGQKVTVTLINGGTMPKVSMGHNFVLLV